MSSALTGVEPEVADLLTLTSLLVVTQGLVVNSKKGI